MTKKELKYINSLIEENNRVKTLLVRFMSALVKVQTVEEIESISLIPIMLEENKKFRAEIKAEAYKEFAERLKERKYLDETGWSHGEHPYIVEEDDIDDVLEELTGD